MEEAKICATKGAAGGWEDIDRKNQQEFEGWRLSEAMFALLFDVANSRLCLVLVMSRLAGLNPPTPHDGNMVRERGVHYQGRVVTCATIRAPHCRGRGTGRVPVGSGIGCQHGNDS